jgi:hypothetical protein
MQLYFQEPFYGPEVQLFFLSTMLLYATSFTSDVSSSNPALY